MKSIILAAVTAMSLSAMAQNVPGTRYTCTSQKTGLVVKTLPYEREVYVYNLKGQSVKSYTDVVPFYAYLETNPITKELKFNDRTTGVTVLVITEQAGRITAELKGNASYNCTTDRKNW